MKSEYISKANYKAAYSCDFRVGGFAFSGTLFTHSTLDSKSFPAMLRKEDASMSNHKKTGCADRVL